MPGAILVLFRYQDIANFIGGGTAFILVYDKLYKPLMVGSQIIAVLLVFIQG
jgi:hypothetical protein